MKMQKKRSGETQQVKSFKEYWSRLSFKHQATLPILSEIPPPPKKKKNCAIAKKFFSLKAFTTKFFPI